MKNPSIKPPQAPGAGPGRREPDEREPGHRKKGTPDDRPASSPSKTSTKQPAPPPCGPYSAQS
jgi:hypothetical protein